MALVAFAVADLSLAGTLLLGSGCGGTGSCGFGMLLLLLFLDYRGIASAVRSSQRRSSVVHGCLEHVEERMAPCRWTELQLCP